MSYTGFAVAGSFQVELSKFAEKAKGNADKVVRSVVLQLGTRLVERTPVGDASYWINPAPKGYVGGRARANWQFGVQAIDYTTTTQVDPEGGMSVARAVGMIGEKASGKVYYWANSLPYIKRLEEGWSRQAPNGMAAVTVLEFNQFISNALAELPK